MLGLRSGNLIIVLCHVFEDLTAPGVGFPEAFHEKSRGIWELHLHVFTVPGCIKGNVDLVELLWPITRCRILDGHRQAQEGRDDVTKI